MRPADLEQKIFDLEEVRVVIRAPSNTQLGDFSYQRKASDTSSITEWIEARLKNILNDFEVVVINGSGEIPHGRTKMSTLRASYIEK